MKKFIPKTKDDINSITELENCTFSEIKDYTMELLSWMQDMHWDVAHGISKYFQPFVNEIENDLIVILKSNDQQWKYAILSFLVDKSSKKLPFNLINILIKIDHYPTKEEIEEEINILARNILLKEINNI